MKEQKTSYEARYWGVGREKFGRLERGLNFGYTGLLWF